MNEQESQTFYQVLLLAILVILIASLYDLSDINRNISHQTDALIGIATDQARGADEQRLPHCH